MEEKKLKILHLTDIYYPIVGGVSTVVDRSSIALSKYADVTVATIKCKKSYKDPERPYKMLRCKGFTVKFTNDGMAFPELDSRFVKEIKEANYDIIHCHFPLNFLSFAIKIGKKFKIPVVVTMHSIYKPDIKHFAKIDGLADFITKRLVRKINKADYIWAVTKYAYDFLKPYGLTKPTYIMNNAIDLLPPQDLTPLNQKINELYNLDENTFVMSFVSRMVKVKNPDLIIDAVYLLKDMNLDFKIFFVGDGFYYEKLKQKVTKLGLQKYIIMTGMISDRELLSAYYARADLALFPSCIDSAGLIQVEAAAYKKATLVIENTAPAEKMTNYVNGLISKNIAEDYAKMILWAYENRDKLKVIGEEAFKTLYRNYSDENIVKEMLDVYKEIIEDYKLKNAEDYTG